MLRHIQAVERLAEINFLRRIYIIDDTTIQKKLVFIEVGNALRKSRVDQNPLKFGP